MPGVNVTTAVRTGPVGAGDVVAGQFFVAGVTERGPIDEPLLVRSFAEYVTVYGDYEEGNLYSSVKTYFDEGGSRCYVIRVTDTTGVGASAGVAGSLTLVDGSAVDAMTITADNVGDWSDNLTISIVAADTLDPGFRVIVKLKGVKLLETPDFATVAAAVSYLNTSSVSHLIVASDEGNSVIPAIISDAALSGGYDGGTPDYSDLAAALALFPKNLGPGAVAAPGFNGTNVWNALADHAVAADRIAICGFAPSTSADVAKSTVAAYGSDSRSSYMGFYFPHILVPSPSIDEIGAGATAPGTPTITISPEAFVAAARAKATQKAGGPWRAGAGQISSATSVSGLAVSLSPSDANLLDDARVNAIRVVGNQIRVYGARSASSDEANWRFITLRDTVNFVVHGVEARMEQFVFETVDGRGNLFANMRASIKGFLEPIRVAGGLYEAFDSDGNQVDPGYSVQVDSTINPATQLATGLVKANVGIRVSSVADKINITITKSNLTAPV